MRLFQIIFAGYSIKWKSLALAVTQFINEKDMGKVGLLL